MLLNVKNLYKIQRIQNNAVRFIYNLNGKRKRESITPYLKKLHFLPVKFRISYKKALLVFKCLNNIAPKYLNDLLTVRAKNEKALELMMTSLS